MRQIAIMVVAVAASVSVADVASARDGCGYGRYYNGYRCVPMNVPGPQYGYSYDSGYRVPNRGIQDLGNGIIRGQDGRLHCANRSFTIQDGVCKPYRGY
jgi:hypothetical protein